MKETRKEGSKNLKGPHPRDGGFLREPRSGRGWTRKKEEEENDVGVARTLSRTRRTGVRSEECFFPFDEEGQDSLR